MTSKGTPHRPIRIGDDLWAKAQAKAAQEGTTASAKARDLLERWAITPLDGPVPITTTCEFPCKWCGETLRVVAGLTEVHHCAVHHTAQEHFAYVSEQLTKDDGKA